MSSRSSFPIIGTSESRCLLVVTFYDPVFLTRPYFVYLLLLGLKFSYKNRQCDSDIIVNVKNLQSSCKTYAIFRRGMLCLFIQAGRIALFILGGTFPTEFLFSYFVNVFLYSYTFSSYKNYFYTFLYPLLRSSSRSYTDSQLTISINFIPSVFVTCRF